MPRCGKLGGMRRGSKNWWKVSKQLMHKASSHTSISALKAADGTWIRTAKEKANLLAHNFSSKWKLPAVVENKFFELECFPAAPDNLVAIRTRRAQHFLSKLDESSATGPDLVPARVLKRLASVLALPFAKLARLIVNEGTWPDLWKRHWICALYKKKSVYDPANYRGVQLTAQISKAMERFLASLFVPQLVELGAFGENQFAYRLEHGARDLLLFLVLSWIGLMASGKQVGVYCSDVSGAFDRVSAKRLLSRLRRWAPHPRFLNVIESWLGEREATVVANNAHSERFNMTDMVYQGTVLGPPLWNIFIADASSVLRAKFFTESVYADDLNAFKAFDSSVSNNTIYEDLEEAQLDLHEWGRGNQVTFDPGKESKHILSRCRPDGPNFLMLGVVFDCKLVMAETVQECVKACGWKIEAILRTQRYYGTEDLVAFYKAHVLSYIEYRTPAICS